MSDKNITIIDNNTINSEEINRKFLSHEDFEDNDPITIDCDGSGGNGGNNDTTGAGDGYDRSGNRVHVPDDIPVPQYLKDYLNSLELPDRIDNKFLIKVGEGTLKAKIADVEEYNMSVSSGKISIPTKLEFNEVAIVIMSMFTLRNIKMTDRVEDTILAVYDNSKNSEKRGTYNSNKMYFYQMMVRLAPRFKKKDIQDVLDNIEGSVPTVEQTKERHLFAVNNGIYNQKTKQLMPFDSKYVFLTKIPVNYKPNPINPVLIAPDGYKWDVDSWIADILDDDDDSVKLMWQVIADCLQPNYSRHKSIWFYSEKGNNGKGTIGQLIKNLLGRGNYASLSVADFKHEFLKETLLGVAANIADENDVDMYIDSVKDYKASVTGDDILINGKYEKPFAMQFTGTNIQMMNGLPKTKDRSDSFYRRIILVPFMKSFTNNGERKYIKTDYINRKEVLEYVLHKALHFEHFDEFIVPQRSTELFNEYKQDNDTVLDFWNELKDQWVWDLLPTQFVYEMYKAWNKRNNPSGQAVKQRDFNKRLVVIIESQGEWEDSRNKNVRSKGRMDKGEPLIKEYGLNIKDRDGNYGPWAHLLEDTGATNGMVFHPRQDTYKGFERK